MSKGVAGFMEHLERMLNIHLKKGEDYATKEDPLLNYHRQEIVSSWFDREQDKVYATHIGQKLARLANLLNKEYDAALVGHDRPSPNNESVGDSFLDLTTIGTIWACDHAAGYRAQLVEVSGPSEGRGPTLPEGPTETRPADDREAGRGAEPATRSTKVDPIIDKTLATLEEYGPFMSREQRDRLFRIARRFGAV